MFALVFVQIVNTLATYMRFSIVHKFDSRLAIRLNDVLSDLWSAIFTFTHYPVVSTCLDIVLLDNRFRMVLLFKQVSIAYALHAIMVTLLNRVSVQNRPVIDQFYRRFVYLHLVKRDEGVDP